VLRAADRVRRVGRYDLAGDVEHPHCCEWPPSGPRNAVLDRSKLAELYNKKCERGDLNPKRRLK
jgi:hypothetical protein